jgi:hypothetical protein
VTRHKIFILYLTEVDASLGATGGPAEAIRRPQRLPFDVGRQDRRAMLIETAAPTPFIPGASVNSVAN